MDFSEGPADGGLAAGGMDLSLGTLQAALWGVLFAPPVMATLYMKWSPSVSKQYPALTTLRELKEEEEGSLYCGMTDAQVRASCTQQTAWQHKVWLGDHGALGS